MILEHGAADSLTRDRLRSFLEQRLAANLAFFVDLRGRWHREHPGRTHPSLCADINPLTGAFRPLDEQRLWGWGDGRAVAIWSAIILSGVLGPAYETLLHEIGEYTDAVFASLKRRWDDGPGGIPFTADLGTERRDDNPANDVVPLSAEDHCSRFVAGAFLQYGLLRGDEAAFGTGMEVLRTNLANIEAAWTERGPELQSDGTAHGPRMIAAGVLVDALQTISALRAGLPGPGPERARPEMIRMALDQFDHILRHHYDPERQVFWERCTAAGRPYRNDEGRVVTDPGHATELAGFMAEAAPFRADAGDSALSGEALVDAASGIHFFADRVGFMATGVMSKYVDMESGDVLPDTQAALAEPRPTAPWWNVAEHAAAALRLYTHTGDPRFLETHRRAHNSMYRYYRNPAIADQLVQTVDPSTLEQLDVRPATGNFDPLHYARSALRQIQALDRPRS